MKRPGLGENTEGFEDLVRDATTVLSATAQLVAFTAGWWAYTLAPDLKPRKSIPMPLEEAEQAVLGWMRSRDKHTSDLEIAKLSLEADWLVRRLDEEESRIVVRRLGLRFDISTDSDTPYLDYLKEVQRLTTVVEASSRSQPTRPQRAA